MSSSQDQLVMSRPTQLLLASFPDTWDPGPVETKPDNLHGDPGDCSCKLTTTFMGCPAPSLGTTRYKGSNPINILYSSNILNSPDTRLAEALHYYSTTWVYWQQNSDIRIQNSVTSCNSDRRWQNSDRVYWQQNSDIRIQSQGGINSECVRIQTQGTRTQLQG